MSNTAEGPETFDFPEAKPNGHEGVPHHHDAGATEKGTLGDSLGWLPAVDLPGGESTTEHERRPSILRQGGNGGMSRTCPGAAPTQPENREETRNGPSQPGEIKQSASPPIRAGSLSRKSVFNAVDARPSSPFLHGAGATASAPPNEELSMRAASADTALTPSQKSKINKLEAKEAKRLSRIIKEEGKVERKALELAIEELAELQNLQKKAVKDEAKCHAVYVKLLDNARKLEAEYLEAKARYEATLAQVQAEEQVLEKIKEHAREVTERMRLKAQEADSLRAIFGVDEREREVRFLQLTGKKSNSSFWR